MARVALSQWEAERLLKEYQQLLRLQDWDISVEIVRRGRLSTPTAVGECQSSSCFRNARIRIAHSDDILDGEDYLADMEDTLIHELLHIVLRDLDIKRGEKDVILPSEIAEERAIESICGALLALKRR